MSSVIKGQQGGELRGIYGYKHGDSAAWSAAVSAFPNKVPRFQTKEECLKFMVDYNSINRRGSNPEKPQLKHIFTMLVGWEQIEKYLLKKLGDIRREEPTHHTRMNNMDGDQHDNVYEQEISKAVKVDVEKRLNLPIHKCTNPASTYNTLFYLYHHMKFGIFVCIKNGELRLFAPFVNDDYRNVWGDVIKIEGDDTLDTYYTNKSGRYRDENIEPDRFKWWANGNIICNELSPKDTTHMQYWGDHFMAPLRDMLEEACRTRNMPDCEFFLNKRDYPQLKVNIPRGGIPVEPYGFIYSKDDRDPEQDVDLLEEHKFLTYAPIVSFYAASPERFSDIPWPSSEDWEAACGEVFPNTFIYSSEDANGQVAFDGNPRDLFTETNFRKFERGWDDGRVQTAFFRGTATGGGTTVDNNQRLKVAHLSHQWKNDAEKGGNEPFLDAAIVGWNMRDKKINNGPMTFLRDSNFGFTAGKHHFTPIYEQSKYKYLVYVDGHCAACRYGFMMRLGSVILKVAPRQVADTMWYFPLLKPYVDHVPVKADLSDLEEKIRWCRQNDEKCRFIGENAKKFYEKYVAKDALLDYVQMCCNEMSRRFVRGPSWWEAPPRDEQAPVLRKPETLCHEDFDGTSRYCVRCAEGVAEEERAKAQEMESEEAQKKKKQDKKRSLAERRRQKAASKKQKI